jgi:PAS domain S-box-containing protein
VPGLFHKIAAHAPVGIYATDAKGRCSYVNRRLCELFGISRRRALGTGWMHAIVPEDLDHVRRLRSEAIGPRKTFELQYRVRSGGKIIWVAATSSALFDGAGRFIGRIGTVMDISALKTAEALLHSERKKAQDAIQGSPLTMLALAGPGHCRAAVVLSPQEWRVLALVSRGRTNKQIAAELRLSAKTVKNYLSNIFQKLDVRRRAEAAVYFAKLAFNAPAGRAAAERSAS